MRVFLMGKIYFIPASSSFPLTTIDLQNKLSNGTLQNIMTKVEIKKLENSQVEITGAIPAEL